ncbi:bifunctional riboflavin kinase/FAD synthetase [Kingella negevensis]|uniref:Riboflavin biosynthesis protein n=1 Tax=Kingella negevensis TaxID=1522312 RepID=A0A238TB40_9NEIS|nr:bifunctional riboflavin kinase/FAD synthetase [Kingella negevensis]MDK4685110.1 bifunctional riboflavin kinase/FAD synthetase [Kingella negevensis]MDK4696704.1 bifunctional riboflavin kinase/FAD synthetase [Kingella negevensis]MDK4707884.1 bifunctional riboflavin kinase/FAD synthetase [Kingella negevensis]MDK4709406.1 bifunctional riboflavin kinase/FAD synthetase [Kingella negevensis]WII93700.1 bifunctional riboflavin kinase/FAD synthetase [Kingella negevensis]
MNIWFGINNIPRNIPNSAVTIGNFDGVHTGHRHILERLAQQASERSLNPVAIVFEPQPNEFFSKLAHKPQPYRLSPLRDKLRLLQETGSLKNICVIRFNAHFANQTADQFIQIILRDKLNTRYLLVGDDFRFGKARGGDFELLSQQPDFVTERTPSILVAGGRASSTSVRQALSNGDIAQATQILGHPYTLSGHVKHGKKLGRIIGCPTANIHLPAHHYALSGVFVVQAHTETGIYRGVASFGSNPTVSNTPESKLEVHLFNFTGNLYGQRLHISFLHKLRDEIKFDSIDELQAQIHQDMKDAENWAA